MEKNAKRQQEKEQLGKAERTLIYQGTIISLEKETSHLEDQTVKETDIVLHPGAVGILAVDPSGCIVLIKQWRRAIKKIIVEIPAGTLERGEKPIDCAHRELQEETGFTADTMTPIGGFYSAPGFCTEYIHLFLARGLKESLKTDAEDAEDIDLFVISLDQALSLLNTEAICDAKTIAALSLYQSWLARLK